MSNPRPLSPTADAPASLPARSPAPAPVSVGIVWLLRSLIAAPLLAMAWLAANLLQNIPMWDEFDTVLTFLLDYRAADSVAAAVTEFFAMANEHCVLTSRLVFVLLYTVTGEANFVYLAVIGNLFMLAAIWVGTRGFDEPRMRLFWASIATLLVFHLQHHENLFSSYASIDHFQVVLLTTGCLVLVARGGRKSLLGAGVLAGLAIFTLAHGVAVLVAAAVILMAQRRWGDLARWLVGSVIILAAFFVLLSSAKLAMAVRWDAAGVRGLIVYWLTMLGGVPSTGHPGWALGWGVALLVALAGLSYRRCWKSDPFLSGLALTAVLGCALIAYGRSNSAEIPALSSRYMVQSAMAWAAVAVLAVRSLRSSTATAVGTGLVLVAALAVNVLNDVRHYAAAWEFTQRRIDAARQYDERATVDGMKRPIFPKGGVADVILATAAREGLYRLPIQKSREVVMPEGLQLYPIVFHLDKVAVGRSSLHVRGWMLTLEELALDLRPHLQLRQGDRSYVFRGAVERRPDVAKAHPNRLDALGSGFYFVIPHAALEPGPYSMRVVLIGLRRTLYNETERTVVIPASAQ